MGPSVRMLAVGELFAMKSAVSFDPEFDEPVKGQEKGRPKRQWLLTILIDVGILSMFLLLPMVWFGNSWYFVPSRPPDEAHRVVHPRGFSIVVSPGWKSQIGRSSFESITATAWQLVPDRHPAQIRLETSGTRKPSGAHNPDLSPASFQGRPARVSTGVASGGKVSPLFDYYLYFQRGGQWYTLSYWAPWKYKSLPPMIQQYFSTFRHESPPEDGFAVNTLIPNDAKSVGQAFRPGGGRRRGRRPVLHRVVDQRQPQGRPRRDSGEGPGRRQRLSRIVQ